MRPPEGSSGRMQDPTCAKTGIVQHRGRSEHMAPTFQSRASNCHRRGAGRRRKSPKATQRWSFINKPKSAPVGSFSNDLIEVGQIDADSSIKGAEKCERLSRVKTYGGLIGLNKTIRDQAARSCRGAAPPPNEHFWRAETTALPPLFSYKNIVGTETQSPAPPRCPSATLLELIMEAL